MSRSKILIPVIVFTVFAIIIIIILNPSHKYKKLSISENQWKAIQESRTENVSLVLEDIRFNDYKLIIDKENNTIYYSLINDSKNKYNPVVEYIAKDSDVKLAILSDEITDEKVKNNYEFKMMIYNENEYHVYNLKCTDLPVLNISYNLEEENSQKNIPMEIYLFDNLSNIPNKITISSGKVKMIGDQYMFSLHMLTPGKNKRDNKLSILNMRPHSEYVLTPANDITTNDAYKTHRIELFINNEYKGTYYIEQNENNNKIETTRFMGGYNYTAAMPRTSIPKLSL